MTLLRTYTSHTNITVTLDKDYYFNKIRLMLQDTNMIINKDPIKGISSILKDITLPDGNRLNTLMRSRTGH